MKQVTLKLPDKTSVVLASGSPRRRDLLMQIGLAFSVQISQADETIPEGMSPQLAVQTLSLLKAADVAKQAEKHAIIIAADTVVVLDGEILTKPKDEEDAAKMLERLSGREHSVLTGVTVLRRRDGKSVSVTEETKVHFRSLSEKEILSYVNSNEPLDKASVLIWYKNSWRDKAGGYGIQTPFGMKAVERIEGDFYNVVGLPVSRLCQLLKDEFDFDI